jgi:hypothetical protein
MTSRAFNFFYSSHNAMCDHTVDGDDEAQIEDQVKAGPKRPKRTMTNTRQVLPNSDTTPAKRVRGSSLESVLLESIEGSNPGNLFEMPSPSHSLSSCYDIPSPSLSGFSEEVHTVTITNAEIDENQIDPGRIFLLDL